ncbi:tetratricopeptide repeat protein [bacterium]|nr:tetratricopeptide repeat protein [bacterium]
MKTMMRLLNHLKVQRPKEIKLTDRKTLAVCNHRIFLYMFRISCLLLTITISQCKEDEVTTTTNTATTEVTASDDNPVLAAGFDTVVSLYYQGNATQCRKATARLLALADSLGSLNYIAKSYNALGSLFVDEGHYRKAIREYKKGLYRRRKAKDMQGLASDYNNLAICWKNLSVFDTALLYIDSSITGCKKYYPDYMNRAYTTLANLYYSQKLYSQASRFYTRLHKIYLEKSDTFNLLTNLLNHANCYRVSYMRDSALVILDKFNNYAADATTEQMARYCHEKGICQLVIGKYEEAELLYIKSLEAYTAIGDSFMFDELYRELGEVYQVQGDYQHALKYYRKSFAMLNNPQRKYDMPDLCEFMAKTYMYLGDADSAIHFMTLHNKLEKEKYAKEAQIEVARYSAKFENEKLQSQKIQLKYENEEAVRKNQKLTISVISVSLLFVISIAVTLLFRQLYLSRKIISERNEQLHQNKIEQLMRENQIDRMTALMEGQEQERSRIATELHDGVGSLLATVKHYFEVVESKLQSNDNLVKKAFNILDKACDEVRRISHDMASNVLSKFGLKAALYDMVDMISDKDKLKVQLIITGMENRLENSVEIQIFRIIQELVGNVLKHAKASEVVIQLNRHNDQINLMVEDNGVGFDYNEAIKKDGMGMRNLKTRVTQLGGNIEFDTNKGSGTTAIVDFKVS